MPLDQTTVTREITHFHICCGSGSGARGFNRGGARVGNVRAKFRCIGGVDVDGLAIADFNRLAGVKGTVLDLFSREQYTVFHGREPKGDWREALPIDLRLAAHGERPNIIFCSMPCKGFSGLLAEKLSKTEKYQALNGLTLRGIWLALEAWKDDPTELFIFENVPRIASRGRFLVDQIIALLRQYGYAVNEGSHDCGELGELAEHRKRYLLVARHMEKVPPFLYQPRKGRVKGVGEVLDKLPLPDDPVAGNMHRMPRLQWNTWVRLAFVEAGRDWRSLNRLRVEDGVLADYGIVPETPYRDGTYGVLGWDQPSGVITANAEATTGRFNAADPRMEGHHGVFGITPYENPTNTITSGGRPSTGTFSVADPRVDGHPKSVQMGVRPWNKPAQTITGNMAPGAGPTSVADPRVNAHPKSAQLGVMPWNRPAHTITGNMAATNVSTSIADSRAGSDATHKNVYRVVQWEQPAGTVTTGHGPSSRGQAVADPRVTWNANAHRNKLAMADYSEPTGAITGAVRVSGGAQCVADPRPGYSDATHVNILAVTEFNEPARTVTGAAHVIGGTGCVADPGVPDKIGRQAGQLPPPDDRLVAVIIAEDGTWHRPFTTFEMAAIQTMFDPEELFEKKDGVWIAKTLEPWMLSGSSDSMWREHIGNAVPSDAAAAIASVMGTTLLLAWSGETFTLSNEPIWVAPLMWGLALPDSREMGGPILL